MITASVIRTIFCTIWSRFWIRRIIRQHFTIARTTGKICWTTTGNASCMLRPIRRIINCTYHYSYGFPISTGRNSRNDMQRHSPTRHNRYLQSWLFTRCWTWPLSRPHYWIPVTHWSALIIKPGEGCIWPITINLFSGIIRAWRSKIKLWSKKIIWTTGKR